MKRFSLLLTALLFFAGCSSLPNIQPAGNVRGTCETVQSPFPKGQWQFAHSIEAVMHGGSVFLTGVAVISSAERSFRCAIMTMEGLSVFEAEWGPELTVNRAMAPFDSRPFAEGLIRDMQLVFLRPRGSPIEAGFLKSGASICRYGDADGEIVDVVAEKNGHWLVRRYSSDLRLLRTVRMSPGNDPKQSGFPRKIELTAHGPEEYKLVMNLLEAVQLEK